jgi:hypothetical protein
MDIVKENIAPLMKFAKNSKMLLNRCTKPDRRGAFMHKSFPIPKRRDFSDGVVL